MVRGSVGLLRVHWRNDIPSCVFPLDHKKYVRRSTKSLNLSINRESYTSPRKAFWYVEATVNYRAEMLDSTSLWWQQESQLHHHISFCCPNIRITVTLTRFIDFRRDVSWSSSGQNEGFAILSYGDHFDFDIVFVYLNFSRLNPI